jgi:hypothetical protein
VAGAAAPSVLSAVLAVVQPFYWRCGALNWAGSRTIAHTRLSYRIVGRRMYGANFRTDVETPQVSLHRDGDGILSSRTRRMQNYAVSRSEALRFARVLTCFGILQLSSPLSWHLAALSSRSGLIGKRRRTSVRTALNLNVRASEAGRLLRRSDLWRQSRHGVVEDDRLPGPARDLSRRGQDLFRQEIRQAAALDRGLHLRSAP